jgi:hypothetical protein
MDPLVVESHQFVQGTIDQKSYYLGKLDQKSEQPYFVNIKRHLFEVANCTKRRFGDRIDPTWKSAKPKIRCQPENFLEYTVAKTQGSKILKHFDRPPLS